VGLVSLRDAIVDAGFTPKIVCYVRPQASFCTSVYAQIVCNGGYRTPFFEYLNDTLTGGRYVWNGRAGTPFEYQKLIDPFAAVFGRDAIIVRRYRSTARDEALLCEFARTLLPCADCADFAIPKFRENGSLDFNTVLACLGNRQATGARIRFAPLRVREVLRFGLRFRKANAAIASRYAMRLPAFELLDIALALPVRRSAAKTRALASARRALTAAGARQPPIFTPHRARPAVFEVVIASTAGAVGWVSFVYGTRIASTALVEFGMISIIAAASAAAFVVWYAVKSRDTTADYRFFNDWSARLTAAGYALVGMYAVVNALLDIGGARYEPDPTSYPGTVATASATFVLTVLRPLRKRLGEVSGSPSVACTRDDRVYLACCYVALFGQLAHAVITDWWLDTLIDAVVVVLVVMKVYQIRRSVHRAG